MSGERNDATEHQWRARPVLAGTLRAGLLAVPLLASSGAVLLVSRWLPPGAGSRWWGLAAMLLTAVSVAMAVERATRRLLPIALLLKLSMIFPDRAPSRFKLARAAAVRPPGHELLWNGTETEPTSTADLVLNLVAALGTHDRRTRGHSERVRLLCDMLAEELKLDDDDRDRLRWSSLLHDVGKMKVSTSILNKPGRLDAKEFDRIKQHPAAGAELAAPLMPWLGEWGDGILDHHEKYDGSGYPNGKAGPQISTAGRLIGLIDAFETMTAARPYKKAMATKAAREELARCAGTHFDPLMVRAFLAISLPRVLWAMGPLSFLFQLPFLRPLAEAGARTSVVAPQAAATALASGAASAVLVGSGFGGITGPATTGAAELLGSPELSSSQGAAPYSLQDRVLRSADQPSPEDDSDPTPLDVSGSQDDADTGPEPTGSAQQGRTTTPDTEAEPSPTSSSGATAPVAAAEPSTGMPSAPSTDAPAESPADPAPEPEPAPESSPAPSQPAAPAAEQPPAAEAPDDPEPVVLVPGPQPVVESPAAEPAPEATAPVTATPAPEPSAPASASSSPEPEPSATASGSPEPDPTASATASATASPEPTASVNPDPDPAPEPTATPTPTTNPQVSAAILDGPADVVSSRTATFTFASGTTWECQVLANGAGGGSSYLPCSSPYTVTVTSDTTHTLRIRDAATTGNGATVYSWTWTVDPAYVSAQAATDPMPLTGIDLSDGLPAGPGASLTLMALLMAAATPVAALARRVRERRTTPVG